MLLGASLLGNMLASEGIIRAGYGYKDLRFKDFQFKKWKGIIRTGYGSKLDFNTASSFN